MEIKEFLKDYIKLYPKEIQIDFIYSNDENASILKDFFSHEINNMYIYAWDEILSNIDVKLIDDEIFDFLLQNQICIEKLSCMHLSYSNLMKIYNKYFYNEALITIGTRMLFDERNEIDEIFKFLISYKENWLIEHMLKCITIYFIKNKKNDVYIEKFKLLLEWTLLNFNDYSILQLVNENKLFLEVLLEKNKNLLNKYYMLNNPLVILALSLNEYTPDYILEEIIKVKNIKYGKIARTNAMIKLNKDSI